MDECANGEDVRGKEADGEDIAEKRPAEYTPRENSPADTPLVLSRPAESQPDVVPKAMFRKGGTHAPIASKTMRGTGMTRWMIVGRSHVGLSLSQLTGLPVKLAHELQRKSRLGGNMRKNNRKRKKIYNLWWVERSLVENRSHG
jgi:hypothetical protein